MKWFEHKDNYVNKLKWDTHKWYVYFQPTGYKNPDKTIRKFCKEIKNLPRKVQREWDLAEFKEFNIGYHVGEDPPFQDFHLSAKTLTKVHELGAGIGMSMYSAPMSDKDGLPEDFYTLKK